ncbi:MAG: DUF2244 domain-containing protein [Rhodospirillales bacterium]|nr:DUF2244 domain-containing protein [Rhodospirillales bacterium]
MADVPCIQMDPQPAGDGRFRAVLRPRRSASLEGIHIVMGAVAAVSFGTGVAFIAAGAWPVFGFLGLEVLLLYGALRLHHWSGHVSEIIAITDETFTVERVDPWGKRRMWSFQPHWMQVLLDPLEGQNRLELRSHGRALAIGAFLTPAERRAVADLLRGALARLATPNLLSARPSA